MLQGWFFCPEADAASGGGSGCVRYKNHPRGAEPAEVVMGAIGAFLMVSETGLAVSN